VPIGDLTDVVMIAAGVTNDCALRQDGTVWCWESNDDRGLSSDEIAVAEPMPVTGITNARFIASGGDHACAVLANGSVQCWGANDCGQLGDGTTTSSPVAVPAEGVRDAVMLALGDCFSCALSSGFQVSCWGDGPKDVQDDVIAIASNGSGPCVEQLGLLPQCSSGDHFAQGIAVSVAGLDLAHLESMAFNSQANGCITVAEDTTRAVWCWGNNSAGQLGAPGSSSGLPVRVLDFP
jgi:alpha-tubulin suppressor-like RCC1 family protein